MNYIPYLNIAKQLQLKKGEILYLTGDLTRLANISRKNKDRFDPYLFIYSILEELGSEGTLLIPSFNYNLKNNDTFDVHKTQPITGSLAVCALKAKDGKRTHNALHSFVVFGKHQKELCALHNSSSFGEDSPFAFMHKHKARMFAIDVDLQSSLTYAHFVEESEKASYRKWKTTSINYINEQGVKETKEFTLFAKKSGYINNVNPLHKVFVEQEILTEKKVNGVSFFSLDLFKAHQIMQEDIRTNHAKKMVFFSLVAWAKTKVKEWGRLG